jgi:hypothetical protein
MKTMKKISMLAAAALIGAASLSCSGDLTDSSAPVELVVTNTQNLQRIDIEPNTDPDCDESVGTITMRLIAKNDAAGGQFTQARITRYRVSYQRTDGGRLVPAPFVRSIDSLIGVGDTTALSEFVIVQQDAVSQAPFAALLPQNGGRDPDTGRPVVQMDVIVEVFGETLAGDRVYDATRFPLDFCYDCNGCD